VNDDFARCGKIHEYLGMTFDYSTPKRVYVGMTEYIESMIDESSMKLDERDKAPSPASEKLLSLDDKSVLLDKTRAEEYHTIVNKGLYASKRARPDIHTVISFLCTRVKHPAEEDWQKLTRLMKYLNGTRKRGSC
jgi:hypothetical protein